MDSMMREKFKFPVIALIAVFAATTVFVSRSFAEPVWTAEISASAGDDSNRLIIGAATDATDGFENAYEGRAMLAGNLQAYFYHPEWAVDTAYFWTDVRDTLLPKQWDFLVSSKYAAMTISWDVSNAPVSVGLVLTDAYSGLTVDMRAQSSYTYANVSTAVARNFTVAASGSIKTKDTIPPDTRITSDMPQYRDSNDINITFDGKDAETIDSNIEYSWSIDGGGWSAWSKQTVAALSGLSDGPHTFAVKARDEAGNEDATPAEARFTVDTAAPALLLNAPEPSTLWPPDGRVVPVTISGIATDAQSGVSSVIYLLDDDYGEIELAGSAAPDQGGGFSFVLNLKAERRGERLKDEYTGAVFKAFSKKEKIESPAGRAYTISVTAVDRAGNETKGTLRVIVPHNK